MQKNIAKTALVPLIMSITSPSNAYQADSSRDWYLIDERIQDQKPRNAAMLLFANKRSMIGNAGVLSLSISDIVMAEQAIDGELTFFMVDNRMEVSINCDKSQYKINALSQFNQDNIKVDLPQYTPALDQWLSPQNIAYEELISFACEPGNKTYEQPFGGSVQPLVGLIAYLNADWSK